MYVMIYVNLNFYVKIETTCLLFLVESLFNHRTAAPPHPPPHDASYKMSKYDMWLSTRIKNHVSSISIYVFMPTNALLCDFELFWEFEIHQKSCLITKIHYFLLLRLMWPLEAHTCDTNLIFLAPNRYHIKYMKNPWYIMGGAAVRWLNMLSTKNNKHVVSILT